MLRSCLLVVCAFCDITETYRNSTHTKFLKASDQNSAVSEKENRLDMKVFFLYTKFCAILR